MEVRGGNVTVNPINNVAFGQLYAIINTDNLGMVGVRVGVKEDFNRFIASEGSDFKTFSEDARTATGDFSMWGALIPFVIVDTKVIPINYER